MAMPSKPLPTEWARFYHKALHEIDRDGLIAAIKEAVGLMVRRLHELGPESPAERQKLLLCLDDMHILQSSATKNGF